MLPHFEKIKHILLSSGIVIIPTDTVLGLACNANDADAISRVFSIKGRDNLKPFAIFIKSINDVHDIANVSDIQHKLMTALLPGQLTFILKERKNQNLISKHLVKDEKIGVRIPKHNFCLNLLNYLEFPIAVTSANPSGNEPWTEYKKINKAFAAKVDYIIPCNSNACKPSTVVDLSHGVPQIIRTGPVDDGTIISIYDDLQKHS